MEDRSRRPLGTIHIKANDGRVTRVEGMYQGRNMEQVEDDSEQVDNRDVDSNEDPDDNIVKKRIKRLFRKTKEDARRVFGRVRRSFVDFVNRW
jgi:hypothetical protein